MEAKNSTRARKKLNVGVIGAGAIAQHGHIPFYINDGKTQVSVADPDPDRLKEVRKAYGNGIKTYSDYREMLSNGPIDCGFPV